jgi:hypothetical protein
LTGLVTAFEEYLTTQSTHIPVLGFLLNLLLSAIVAHFLARIYVRCGRAISNRSSFAANFVPLTVTTVLIITVVKSSLALSLGLVGALSIVRFRSAIKEPEELNYLFLAIALGLGFGAGQWRITLIAFLAISAILLFRSHFSKHEGPYNFYLTVGSQQPNKVEADAVVKVLKEHCSAASISRFDETPEAIEAAFLIDFDSFEQFQTAKQALRALNESLTISFIETKET